jgi:hypothetical protein
MPRVFANGGMIGKTLNFTSTTSYTSYGYSSYPDPITYVGGATATAVTTAGTTATVTFTSLAGGVGSVQTGDLVIATVAVATNNTDLVMSMTTAGYTTLYDLYQSETQASNLGVFYKVMGATPDTSAQTGTMMPASVSMVLAVQVWRGVSTTTPFGAAATATNANGTNVDPSLITTTVNGSKVIVAGMGSSTRGIVLYTTQASLENVLNAAAESTRDAALMVGSVIVSGGGQRRSGTVVNPVVFSASSNGTTNDSSIAVTLELMPSVVIIDTLTNAGVWDTGWRYVANTP